MSTLESDHIRKTIFLFVIAIALILFSIAVGLTDNLPMIFLLFIGVILFFFAALRHWEKVSYYVVLIVICLLIFIVNWFVKGYLTEGIAMFTGFISAAGIVAGVVGISYYSKWGES